jgi:hypothetical protein
MGGIDRSEEAESRGVDMEDLGSVGTSCWVIR